MLSLFEDDVGELGFLYGSSPAAERECPFSGPAPVVLLDLASC